MKNETIKIQVSKDDLNNLIRNAGLTPNQSRRNQIKVNAENNLGAILDALIFEGGGYLLGDLE